MRRAGYKNASMLSLTLTLERDRDAPARARTMIRGLRTLLGAERTEDATLLVSELVTNAVKYGTGDVELRETGGAEAGGYGLQLVDRIADDWGVTHASMHVWFELSF